MQNVFGLDEKCVETSVTGRNECFRNVCQVQTIVYVSFTSYFVFAAVNIEINHHLLTQKMLNVYKTVQFVN